MKHAKKLTTKHARLGRGAIAAACVVVAMTVPLSFVSALTDPWGDSTEHGSGITYGWGNAQIVVSADGTTALAVWETADLSLEARSATISGNVETWGSVTKLTPTNRVTDGGGSGRSFNIALSDDGATAAVIWLERDPSGENYQIQLAAATASISGTTATWSAGTSLTGDPVNYPVRFYDPQIKISQDGTKATAVWLRQSAYLTHNVDSASATISGGTATWSTPTVLDGPFVADFPYPYTDPSIGLSADGTKATATWIHGDGNDFATVTTASATISGNDATWSEPQALTASSRNVQSATVAVSDDGTKAVAAFRLNPGSGVYQVQSAAATIIGNAATWGEPTLIDDGQYDGWNVKVALSGDGTKTTALWIGYTEGDDAVKTASGTVSGTTLTWGATTFLETHSNLVYSGLELSDDGTVALASWRSTKDVPDRWFRCTGASAIIDGTTASWGTPTTIALDAGNDATLFRVALSDDGARATSICGKQDTSNGSQTYSSRSAGPEVTTTTTVAPTSTEAPTTTGAPTTDAPTTTADDSSDALSPTLPATGSNHLDSVVPALLVFAGFAARFVARRRQTSSGA